MTEPTLIRIEPPRGDRTVVRVRMTHEMESGQRKDASGRLVPAWYIQEVLITLNGRQIMTAEWGPAVSKNPFVQFSVKGAKSGDKLAVSWKDNRGTTRTDEATVV